MELKIDARDLMPEEDKEGVEAMDQTAPPATLEPPPRLDLLAFPSETRGRFRMLMVAALMLGLHLASTLWEVATDRADLERLQEALTKFRPGGGRLEEPVPAAEAMRPREFYHDRFHEVAGVLAPRWLNLVGHLAFLIAATAFIYRTHPWRLRRAQRPSPFGPSEAPLVVGYLRRCAEALGVPHLRIEHRRGLGGGQAYGLKNRGALLLHGTPEVLEKGWGDVTKAIALHELAHVVHGDAPDREKAKAVWLSLLLHGALILVAFPLIAVLVLRPIYEARGWPRIAMLEVMTEGAVVVFLPFGVMLLFIRMVWGGLVRSRELSADWRVGSWGLGAALDQVLRTREAMDSTRPVARWWRLLWRLHPSFRVRRQVLADPRRLFRVSSDLAFGTGLLLALAAIYFLRLVIELGVLTAALVSSFWVALALPDHPLFVLIELLGMILLMLLLVAAALFTLSYLVASALGVQVQREAVADLAEPQRGSRGYLRLLIPAFLVAAGLEVGFLWAPFSPFASMIVRPAAAPFWLLGMTFLNWLWLVYVRAATRLSLGGHVGKVQPRRWRSRVLLSAIFLLGILYWPAASARLTFLMAEGKVGLARPQNFEWNFRIAIILAFSAMTFYLLWSGAGLVLAFLRLSIRRAHCPTCGEKVYGFPLGRVCIVCRENLSPWVFTGPPREPGSPEPEQAMSRTIPGAVDSRSSQRDAWIELLVLTLGLMSLFFFFLSGIYTWSFFLGTLPDRMTAYWIGTSLLGVLMLAGTWALPILFGDRGMAPRTRSARPTPRSSRLSDI